MNWIGVHVDSNRNIIDIEWYERGLRGSLNFLFLPSTLRRGAFERNQLSGGVVLGQVDMLSELSLSGNQLSGPFPLNDLPAALTRLWGHKNHFAGVLDLTALPPLIQILYLYENALSGTLCFTSLPASIVELALDCNLFEGSLDVSHLPSSLKSLSLV